MKFWLVLLSIVACKPVTDGSSSKSVTDGSSSKSASIQFSPGDLVVELSFDAKECNGHGIELLPLHLRQGADKETVLAAARKIIGTTQKVQCQVGTSENPEKYETALPVIGVQVLLVEKNNVKGEGPKSPYPSGKDWWTIGPTESVTKKD